MKYKNTSRQFHETNLLTRYRIDDRFVRDRTIRRAAIRYLRLLDQDSVSAAQQSKAVRKLKRSYSKYSWFHKVSKTLTFASFLLFMQGQNAYASTQLADVTSQRLEKDLSHYSQAVPVLPAVNLASETLIVADQQSLGYGADLSLGDKKQLLHIVSARPSSSQADDGFFVSDSHVLTVIDTSVPDWEDIYYAVTVGEILVLDNDGKPLEQILGKLQKMPRVELINIISHGRDGEIALANTHVTAESLQQQASLWQAIGAQMDADAQIQVFGCEVAKTQKGKDFIDALADVTQAEVAGSINPTGDAAQQGDWTLEYFADNRTGQQLNTFNSEQILRYSNILVDTTYNFNSFIQCNGSDWSAPYSASCTTPIGDLTARAFGSSLMVGFYNSNLDVVIDDDGSAGTADKIGAIGGGGVGSAGSPRYVEFRKTDNSLYSAKTVDLAIWTYHTNTGQPPYSDTLTITAYDGSNAQVGSITVDPVYRDDYYYLDFSNPTAGYTRNNGFYSSAPTITASGSFNNIAKVRFKINQNTFYIDDLVLSVGASNNAPTNITLGTSSINQSATGAAAVVGSLTTTDLDGSDTHTYSLVTNGSSGYGSCGATGDDNNSSFQISSANLQTASSLSAGSYNVCVQTNDGTDTYQKTFAITVNDDVAPSGHSVSFDDTTINASEVSSQSFTFASAEVGATYSYTISSSGGGTNVTGSGTLSTATDQITGLSLSGLGDGTLTLSVVVTDSSANAATAVTDTATLDSVAPSGHSVSLDSSTYNATSATSASFTFADGEIGAAYSYTISSSGGGVNVTGSGILSTATDQITGIDLSSLGDGTLTISVVVTDVAGNAATTVTDTATMDTTAPSGHSVSFDDSAINTSEASSQSFTFASGEVGASYSYSISSSGGGTPVTGSGTLSTATDQITGLDLSGLSDGTLTLSVVLTDTAGNAATAVTDTAALDGTAPSGHSVSLDSSTYNSTSATSASFTFASGEVGASYSYSISSSGGGTNVTGSGTLSTATDQITGIDLSGLSDGTLTISVVLTDPAGNAATAVTDTATLDATVPSGHSVSLDSSTYNATSATSASFTFAGGEVGAGYSYSISSSGGGTNVTGSGTLSTATDQITGVDLSGLGDGTLTISVVVTDVAGNAATAVTDTATLDTTAPSGHSISFDDSAYSATEAGSASFTFASGEVGASYSYSISSSGGGTNVTGSGTLSSATDQISGLDLSGLGDGTLTVSVVLTDTAGNAATAVTDTATLDSTVPSGHSVSLDSSTYNSTSASSASFTFASGEIGAAYSYTISSSGGGTNVTGSGTLSTATDQITGIDLSGLGDGTLTISVVVTDTAGNAATAVTDTATMDATAPSGHSVSFDDSAINTSEASSQSFTFASGEVGASYSYSISSSGGGTPVTGSGTLSTATDQITGLDLSGLSDGTLTLSVVLTDTAGNAATAVTDTAALDGTAPSGHSVSLDSSTYNSTSATSASFTFASGEVGASYSYTISSSGGGTNVTGSGILSTATDQITGIDISGLGDGTLTISVIVTDPAGNAATAVTDTATLDATAPSGQSVSLDSSTYNATSATSASFTFAGGEVGAGYSYTISSSGGGTNVTGSGTLSTATDQITGVDLSGLGDGTLTISVVVTDVAGNAATAVTDTATLDTTAPSGHSVSFDDSAINTSEASSQSFTFASGEVGASYSYSISSSGGGTPVTGSGTLATATDQITGLDLSGLSNGTLTLSVVLTDTAGNAATAVTDTAALDGTAPSGHSVSLDNSSYNATTATSASFTFASGEVGASYSYSISSSGGGTPVTGSGTLATATDQITGIDLSGLSDGTLTISVIVTDPAGNAATAVTDTATLDATAPSGQSVTLDSSTYNATSASSASFTFAGGEVGAGYSYTISSSGGGTNVTGSGTLSSAIDQINSIDLSGLNDGTLTISVIVTDVAGNAATAVTDTATLDTTAPSGHSVSFDDSTIGSADASSQSFTFAGGEVGASYSYSISSSGGGTPVTGSGTLTTATDQITGIDLSGLSDGTVTLSVIVTDTAGNAATAVTNTATLDTAAPSGHSVSLDNSTYNTTDAASASFTFAGGEVGASYSYSISSSGGGTAVTGSGTLSTATDQITGIDLTGLSDGTLTLSVVVTDPAGNAATAVTDTAILDAATPSGYSISVGDTVLNASEATDLSFTFAGAEVGATYNYSISSSGGGTLVTGSGTLSSATQLIDSIDVSGLSDGTLTISVTLTDTSGNTGAAVTATAELDRTAPTVATNSGLTLKTGYTKTISASLLSATDAVSSSLTFTVTSVPTNGSLKRSGNVLANSDTFTQADLDAGLISYTHDGGSSTSDSFGFSVMDAAGNSLTGQSFSLTVSNTNAAPTITGSPETSVAEDSAYSFIPTTSDSDGDTLTFSISNQPLWTDFDSATGALTGTPVNGDVGSYSNIVISVSDGTASVSLAAFSITVSNVNDAPVITGTPGTTAEIGVTYSFTPTASDVDIGDTLTFSISNQPSWASFDTSTGALTGTPASGDEGDYAGIVISVSDGTASTSLPPFDITVVVATDTDGDNVPDYQEVIDGTDPNDPEDYLDTTDPVISAPDDVVFDSTGLYTVISLTQLLGLDSDADTSTIDAALAALVSDNIDGDGCCEPNVVGMVNNAVLLPPGLNYVTWQATDHKGNTGSVDQIVRIRPLVSFAKDKTVVEGAPTRFKVLLNGAAPDYPFSVPVIIDTANSTADSSDHDLSDNLVIFTSDEISKVIAFNINTDSTFEGTEILTLKLDDQTSDSDDLSGGYDPDNIDIYDINSGVKNTMTFFLVEGNIAPEVTLNLQQNGSSTILVTPDGGNATMTATVVDPNTGDTFTYSWSASASSLVDIEDDINEATFEFDPSVLKAGRYRLQLTVTDSEGASDTARLYFQVVAALPTLIGSTDSDGDGTDDATEGTGDSDDDGIPDYLDNIVATNVLPEQARVTDSFLLECDPGVLCRLGQFAMMSEGGGARLSEDDLSNQSDLKVDKDYDFKGGIFDFEIQDLPTLGQTVRIVLPLTEAIPENAVYRKYQNGEWSNFVEDANNEIHSAPGRLGYCPPPGDDSWVSGMQVGYYCVQLTIEDGGANDADGLVNAVVEDPGAIGVRASSAIQGNGWSGTAGVGLLALLGALLMGVRRNPKTPADKQ
ncbi:DUF4347 domain-containing protein [Gynuella sunshinyii]|uniref:DUF4347 domain-containing protein n=1 Tax=Gynuella sunshinyii YC6258 TaxID=1445510 RepID=A0A0C5VFL1_9GAMM|nr:DUF4347 domain-containing protein [Gynuella sunshinyii]AJQ93342.1 hypothetical Protein YC6258_01294 [Gynuella sunshinyii YC6258]